MKRSDVRRYGAAVGVTLAAVIVLGLVGAAFAQAPDGAAPTVGDAAAATVASRISYQGVLREGGVPVNGTRNHAVSASTATRPALTSITRRS